MLIYYIIPLILQKLNYILSQWDFKRNWNLFYFLSYRALVDFVIYFKKSHVNIKVFLYNVLAFSMEYHCHVLVQVFNIEWLVPFTKYLFKLFGKGNTVAFVKFVLESELLALNGYQPIETTPQMFSVFLNFFCQVSIIWCKVVPCVFQA